MERLLVLTGDQNYGRSIASSSANTALSPELLNAGAIGIFGNIDRSAVGAAVNTYGLASESAGSSAAGLFDTDEIAAGTGEMELFEIIQGAAFPVRTGWIQRRAVKKIIKQAYVAPAKKVSFIGFNGVNGSTNMPTITNYSEAGFIAVQREETTVDRIREQENYGVQLMASDTEYSALAAIVTRINRALNKTHTAFIVSNGSYSATSTATGTMTLTNGSTTISFATDIPKATWAVAVNDFVSIANDAISAAAPAAAASNINGTVYRVVAVDDTANTITLDRPYRGASGTVSQANVQGGYIAKVSSITAYGIKLVVDNFGDDYEYAVQDLLQAATITYGLTGVAGCLAQNMTSGLGTGAAVVKKEKDMRPYRGQFDTVDSRMKQIPLYANASTNYDAYTLYFDNSTIESGISKSITSSVTIFTPTGNTSNANFEGTLKDLCPQAAVNF